MTTMPSDNTPRRKEEPVSTPGPTAYTLDTAAGRITVQAGTEQYRTQDHGLTTRRPMVAFWRDGEGWTVQAPAAQIEELGRALIFAAMQAHEMAEEA